MDPEQVQFLFDWVNTRFCRSECNAVSSMQRDVARLAELPGVEDGSLFVSVFEHISGATESEETIGGPKLRLMHRLKTLLKRYSLDAADALTSIYRRLDHESGKSDLLAVLYFASFLTPRECECGASFPSGGDLFGSSGQVVKRLRNGLSILLRTLEQMRTVASGGAEISPFQCGVGHFRSSSAVQKRHRLALEAELEDLRILNNQLQAQLLAQVPKPLNSTNSDTDSDKKQVHEEIFYENDRIIELMEEIQGKESLILKLRREIAKVEHEKARMGDEIDVLQGKISDLGDSVRKLSIWKEKFEEYESLKSEYSELQAGYRICMEDKRLISDKLHKAQLQASKADSLSKELQNIESKYIDILRANTRLSDELDRIRSQKSLQMPMITKISVEETADECEETEELRRKLTLAEVEIINLKTTIEAERNQDLKRKIEETELEVEMLSKSKGDWLNKYALLENKLSASEARFRSEKEQVSLLKSTLESMDIDTQTNRTQMSKLRLENSQLKAEADKAWKAMQEEYQLSLKYKAYSESLQHEVSDLKAKEVLWVVQEGTAAKAQANMLDRISSFQKTVIEVNTHIHKSKSLLEHIEKRLPAFSRGREIDAASRKQVEADLVQAVGDLDSELSILHLLTVPASPDSFTTPESH